MLLLVSHGLCPAGGGLYPTPVGQRLSHYLARFEGTPHRNGECCIYSTPSCLGRKSQISLEAPGLVGFCPGSGLAGVRLACMGLGTELLVLDPGEHSAVRSGGGCVMTHRLPAGASSWGSFCPSP